MERIREFGGMRYLVEEEKNVPKEYITRLPDGTLWFWKDTPASFRAYRAYLIS